MATVYHFPVIVWKAEGGFYTGSLLEYSDRRAAFGPSVDDVLWQLKEYLAWRFDKYPAGDGPDFLEPRVVDVAVPVRPEYREESEDFFADDRVYPCSEQVVLKIPCVYGHAESGLSIGVLPTLDVQFNFYEEKAAKSLAIHFASEALRGRTPAGLSRYFGPVERALHVIAVNVKTEEGRRGRRGGAGQDDGPARQLLGVAEPMSSRTMKRRFGKAWEREADVMELFRRLDGKSGNVLLVGEPGVGKTTILAAAVRKLERADEAGADGGAGDRQARVWMTSASRIIAGMQYLGQWEGRCEEMVEQLSKLRGILFIENLLDLVKAGGREPVASIAAFLLPYLKRGELRMVGEVTRAELDACRRLLPGLVDVFQALPVAPFTGGQAIGVLEQMGRTFAQNSHVEVEAGSLQAVYRLFSRFMPYSVFPGRATSFTAKLFEKALTEKNGKVTAQSVVESFVAFSGLPELFLRDELMLNRADVLECFCKKIIGQEAPCSVAADLVMKFKAGMNDVARPLGVLMFCGPTGVGKTALARVLADYMFGHGEEKKRLIRLDMSEYSGYGAAEKLLSQPDRSPSELIRKVRQYPFCVVLLDEIEKASPEVFDVFLGLFDEGRLVDRYGRVTDFRSSIVIMTSNLGARQQSSPGFRETGAAYESEVRAFFRPELFNRLDGVVSFSGLSEPVIRAITEKELQELGEREGFSSRGLRLAWTPQVVDLLAREGFDARYGARPLQRTMERLVVTPAARYLVENAGLRDGTILVSLDAGGNAVVSAEENDQ